MNEIGIGSVVMSKMGRDKGNCFLVLSVKDNYAQIADGDIRKIEKPKKKKLMHLKVHGAPLCNLKQKLLDGKVIHNKELISALKAYQKTECEQ